MWQRRTCHWQGRNPHLRVQFDRDKDPLEEGVQQLQDAYQGDEGLQQPSSLSPLRDTQNCASFHCGILALEPVERRRFVMTEHWEHFPRGCKKKRHVQPSNRAWGWLQPSDKSHNHPHSQYTTCTVLRSWKAARSETGVQCRRGLGYRLWLANGYALDSYRVDRCWQLTSDGRTCMVHPVHTQCYTLQTCQRLVSFCAMHAAKTEPGLEAKKARGHGFEGLWMVTSEIKISYIVT